jgi:hypothetical protein
LKNNIFVCAVVAAVVSMAGSAAADSLTHGVIFGSGNANGNFTVARDGGVELGLRAKIPFSGVTNYDGVMTYAYTSADIDTGGKSSWNFDWAINTDYTDASGLVLSDLTYVLEFDYDPSLGVDYQGFGTLLGLTGDPVTPTGTINYFDHAIGNNSTVQGPGHPNVTADATAYAAALDSNNVLQNSWRGQWMWNLGATTFDPYAQGTYNVRLSAYDGAGLVTSTEIKVEINGGAAPIPEPATMTLLGLGIAGMGLRYRKRKAA